MDSPINVPRWIRSPTRPSSDESVISWAREDDSELHGIASEHQVDMCSNAVHKSAFLFSSSGFSSKPFLQPHSDNLEIDMEQLAQPKGDNNEVSSTQKMQSIASEQKEEVSFEVDTSAFPFSSGFSLDTRLQPHSDDPAGALPTLKIAMEQYAKPKPGTNVDFLTQMPKSIASEQEEDVSTEVDTSTFPFNAGFSSNTRPHSEKLQSIASRQEENVSMEFERRTLSFGNGFSSNTCLQPHSEKLQSIASGQEQDVSIEVDTCTFPFSTSFSTNTRLQPHSEKLQGIASGREGDVSTEADRSTIPFIRAFPPNTRVQSHLEAPRTQKREMETQGQPKGEKNGVVLTWKDLRVSVSGGKNGNHAILQEVTGYAEPGKVLAIMGPSGCGKSTLLDTLAGRLSSNVHRTGEILINGRKEKLAFGTSAYVTQDDTLMTTLTVREAIYYSAQLQLPESMSISEKKERAEITIKEMGMQDAIDTRIGGWSSKGLSGGQKRRVSICIEILTRPRLLFLDEPTSGLDSAASFHVMNQIAKLACQDGRTVIASIHQPSSEVFELFHNLCLLSSGKTVYFGPLPMAEQFFASAGFPCPTMRNPSDHYLRTINKDFDEDIEQGFGGNTTEKVVNILVNSYKSSETYREVKHHVSKLCQQNGKAMDKKGSQAKFITQCLVLTKRSFVNMYRDLGYYWLRLAIYIALCLCVGTIFYDVGFSYGSIQARGSMLMFVAAFLTFMAIGGFPSFVEDMKIFGRERLNGHYGVGAFVVGNTFSSIPYLIVNSLIPGAIAYYLVGLQKGFEHFAYFALVLFASMMLVESLMMIVASIVPDFLMGIITGAGIQGVMMLNGGFFRLPNDLPKPFWRYPMYYISFHKYAFQGFYKNEFEGLSFPNNQVGGSATISGEEILKNMWQVEMGYSKWVDLAILLGMVVLYRLLFLGIIKTVEKVKPIIKGFKVVSPMPSGQIFEDPSTTP